MYIDGIFRRWFDRHMLRKIILIFVLFLTSCEPNITEEFKFYTNTKFSLYPKGGGIKGGLKYTINFDFLSYLTLSYSEDEGLTYFHLKEKIRNMSLDDKFFSTKPYCTSVSLYDKNGTRLEKFVPEKNGKYFRDEQNDLNCEGVLNMTLEEVKKIKWYGTQIRLALKATNTHVGFFYKELGTHYRDSKKLED